MALKHQIKTKIPPNRAGTHGAWPSVGGATVTCSGRERWTLAGWRSLHSVGSPRKHRQTVQKQSGEGLWKPEASSQVFLQTPTDSSKTFFDFFFFFAEAKKQTHRKLVTKNTEKKPSAKFPVYSHSIRPDKFQLVTFKNVYLKIFLKVLILL